MMVYYLNEGSQILAFASILVNSMLCYWIEMPVRECFEISLLAFGVLSLINIKRSKSLLNLTRDDNRRFNDQTLNLLGRNKMGIMLMTFDTVSMKVIYKNNQMRVFENQALQPMVVGDTYERSDIFQKLSLNNLHIRTTTQSDSEIKGKGS